MSLSRLTKITGPGIATDTNWVGNNADFTGITTTATSFNIGVTTIHSTLIEAHNIKSTGIVTATGAHFSGNVSIGGTLTYEDTTNIDSVGLITARGGIRIPNNTGKLELGSSQQFDISTGFSSGEALINTTGVLNLATTSFRLRRANGSAYLMNADQGGGLYLYHNGGSPKLSTTNKGITVGTGVTVETNGNSNFVGVSSLGTGATGAVYLYNPDADALSATTNDDYGWKAKTYAQGLQVNSKIYLSRSGSNGLQLSYNNATGSYITALSGFLRLGVPYGSYLNLYANDVYIKDRLETKTFAHFQKVSSTNYKTHLYGGNSVVKLTTEESGINVVGTTTTTQLAVTGVSTFTGNIVPSSDSATDIGTNSVRFANIYADTLYGDGSNLTGLSGVSVANQADNRLITATGTTDALNGEANLTFNGSTLDVTSSTRVFSPNGNVRYQLSVDNSSGVNIISKNAAGSYNAYQIDGSAFTVRTTATNIGGMGERFRIDSSGRVFIGTTTEGNSSADNLTVADSGESGITIRSGTSNGGHIYFSDATSGTAEYQGLVSYQHNGDFMKFGTAATERFRIDSNGKLLKGHTADVGQIRTQFNQDNQFVGSNNAGIRIASYADNAYASSLEFVKSRSATKGTNTLVQNGDVLGQIYWGAADGTNYQPAAYILASMDGTTNTNDIPTKLVFGTASDGANGATERLRIDHNGRIGSSHTLSGVADYNRLMLHNPNSGSCWMQLTSTATGSTPNTDGLSIGLNTSNIAHFWLRENAEMHFATNNSLRWRITSSGDIYPQGNYSIGLNSNTAFRMQEVNSVKFVHRYGNSGSATNNQQEAIWYGGGITVMHDNQTLQTTNYTWGLTGNRGYPLIRIRNANNAAIYAEAGGISSGSDYRMKENIEEITNGIETVKKLKPSKYNIRKSFNPEDDGTKHHGFIAHEVQEAIPDIGNIVTGTKDAMEEVFYHDDDENIPEGKKAGDSTGTFTDNPDMQGIDYGHMTPVLAAAIKELITKVETLETKVATLEGS